MAGDGGNRAGTGGPRRLADWPWVSVEVECSLCRRAGRYRLARLAERHGAEIALGALLLALAGRCGLNKPGVKPRQYEAQCGVRYRVPVGGPLPEGAAAREAVPGESWPPRPKRLPPQPSRSTIGDLRRQGITHVGLHCYGLNRHGVTCHGKADVALDALGMADDALYADIARRGWRCQRCGHGRPSVMPRWPSPSEAHARRLSDGASPVREVNGVLMPVYPDPPAHPEPPAVPSAPNRSLYEVVEDDDGTYAVVWAETGVVARMDGAPQRGLDVNRADDVADLLEALDRISARRGGGQPVMLGTLLERRTPGLGGAPTGQ